MNKQELIERIEGLKNIFGNKTKYIEKNTVIELVSKLDEPEAGHADEAPRYVKNVLSRLRELPLHDREVWLKAIMDEFEKDFSRAKWREGYEQGKFVGKVGREKVKVPQFVADWIKKYDLREETLGKQSVFDVFDNLENDSKNGYYKDVKRWIDDNRDLFARAWLDGYEVEKEKRYLVKVKATGQYLRKDENSIRFSSFFISDFTRNDIEDLGFAWVFDCSGIQIEEVE
ncbi:DUF1642 domain-containing protein [Streptococcus oralis]|uniref:DUF1642 domain-containing protein n=1 Tax=Streptococcus oralis TaxID=1303 RepID=UPI001BB01787|nr:DUF1642 domain-containing protein [Streptococcus oralis]MBS3689490.1 DUF1642 domain-containing protein [Streptococcus oralis]